MARALRDAYGETLMALAAENDKVVALDADLASSTKSISIKKTDPNRFFDMGIAEADMIGHAAGFAASGYIPFVSSFAMFATGRCWEQIRNSVAYPRLNVKICATHAGISVGEDGVSHQATEDIAIMRAIPNMEIYVPCDAAETKALIRHVAETKTPCYVRMGRIAVEDVYPDDKEFDFTKINVLREGSKAVIFATGIMVQAALEAAERLDKEGMPITVVDVCAIKPCDEEGIVNLLQQHKIVFTAEEHSTIGGLGSLVCELAADKCPRKVIRIGLKDKFAESGNYKDLLKKYKLDADGVYDKIRRTFDKEEKEFRYMPFR